MGYSDFRRGFEQVRTVKTGKGSSAANDRTITIELPNNNLTAEHILHVSATQARTSAATSSDVRKIIKSAELVLSGGRKSGTRISLSGYQLDLLSRLTENQPAPVVDLGAGGTASAKYQVELHHLMDGSRVDMMTAINLGEYSGVSLVINLNAAADSGFVGGTANGEVIVAVDVQAKDYPVMPAQPNSALVASHAQYAVGKSLPIVATGVQDDMPLRCMGKKTRFILISAFDTNGAPSDAILDRLELDLGNYKYETTYEKVKRASVHKRGLNVVGAAVIDFGDDPLGWTPDGILDAALKWSALAVGRVEFTPVTIEQL